MVDNISYIPQQPYMPVTGTNTGVNAKKGLHAEEKATSISFKDVLHEQVAEQKGIKFSGHAQKRLKARNIELSSEQLDRMSDAMDRAAGKGARDSLLMVDNVAAVVSVANRTVVTVVDSDSMKDNVFTNIDSAIIA